MWEDLEGDTYGGIPCRNLYDFLVFVNHCDQSYYSKYKKVER